MMTFTELPSVPSGPLVPFTGQLRLAVAAYLARFKGSSRYHTESDLRCYLTWCAERGLAPLAARRPHLELYIRWMQETRRFKPSTRGTRAPCRLTASTITICPPAIGSADERMSLASTSHRREYHKLFDLGILGLDPGLQVLVSARFSARITDERG